MIHNLPITTELHKAMQYMDAKTESSLLYNTMYAGSHHNRSTYTDIIDSISRRDNLFFLNPMFDVRRQELEDWTQSTQLYMEELGATPHRTASIVFNTRTFYALFYEYHGSYIVLTSKEPPSDLYYRLVLTCMLLYLKDDANLVRRLASVIQSGGILEFNQEELKLIEDYATKAKIKELTKDFRTLIKTKNYTADIDAIKNDLAWHELEIRKATTKLRDIQLLQYNSLVRTEELDENFKDFVDYITNMSHVVLDSHLSIDKKVMSLTILSNMRIPETDESFFKAEAIENHNHLLHGYDKTLVPLFKDVMNQRVRLPIRASYELTIVNGQVQHVKGLRDFYLTLYDRGASVVNAHINRFNCFDGYKVQLIKALDEQDCIGVFEILQQCTGTINVFDSIVMKDIIAITRDLNRQKTILQIRTDNGWEPITLEEYYEKIKTE